MDVTDLRGSLNLTSYLIQDLLNELKDAGHIRPRTKWKNIYPRVAKDPRYISILGNAGSNPLELFWDMVDAMDQEYEVRENVVKKVFEASGFQVVDSTTYDEFCGALAASDAMEVAELKEDDIREVYDIVSFPCYNKASTDHVMVDES